MSDSTKYTMYRRDARGTIEVDLNDPVYSLDQLIEKQCVIVETHQTELAALDRRISSVSELVTMSLSTLHRLETARDAARKALGPSDREQEESGTE